MISDQRRVPRIRMSFFHRVPMRLGIAITAMLVYAPHAKAACTFTSGYSVQNMLMKIPNVTVPRDIPVGAVLATVQLPAGGPMTSSGSFATCTAPGNSYWYFNGGTAAALPSNTANTNIPGIGLRFFFQNNSGMSFKFNPAGYGASESYVGKWNWYTGGNGYFGVEVVVTGRPGSGQINGAVTATVTLDSLLVTNITTTTFTATALSCVTPNVTVPLGTHNSSELQGVGTGTAAVTFNLSLNSCPAGLYSIKYQIDPTTAVVGNATNGVVALDASSTATGVGVQLLNNSGVAFALGSQQTFSGYSFATGGSYTIPLKARYYQTGAKVGPGTANTSMTFTMNYQ
jgi:major type 1 subunit fimbrin (pilin)